MTTIAVAAKIHPVELTTEEVHRLVNALNDELRRRKEVGESPWLVSQVRLVMRRLESGWPEQHKALVSAARDKNGSISRSKVLQIAKRDGDANLNGFRKPFGTAVRRLIAEGQTMPGAEFPFWAEYNDPAAPGTATGFFIDEASLPVVRAALDD